MDVINLTPTFQVAAGTIEGEPITPAMLARYIAHTKRALASATGFKERYLLQLQLIILENMAGDAAPNPPAN